MTKNQKMAMAEKRIQKIYTDLQTETPLIKTLGVTPEEKKITFQLHTMMWLKALEQKPGNFEEADKLIRSVIIVNALMIESTRMQ